MTANKTQVITTDGLFYGHLPAYCNVRMKFDEVDHLRLVFHKTTEEPISNFKPVARQIDEDTGAAGVNQQLVSGHAVANRPTIYPVTTEAHTVIKFSVAPHLRAV